MTSKTFLSIKLIGIATASAALKSVNKDLGTRFFLNQLATMPGLPAKVGQLLGTKLGGEWEELAHNRMQAALDEESAMHLLETLHAPLYEQIARLGEAVFAASVGQVHKATLKNGQVVAVKIQYPGIRETMLEQLDLVILAARNSPGKNFGLDVVALEQFLRLQIENEVDYLHEAAMQRKMRDLLREIPGVKIPEVFFDLSSSQVLVQEWVEAIPLASLSGLSVIEKREFVDLFSSVLLKGVFVHGVLHTDLHPKNWGRSPTGELVLYDFGSTLELNVEVRRDLWALVWSGVQDSPLDCLQMFQRIGFAADNLLPIQNQLPELLKILMEPFTSITPWDPKKWDLNSRIDGLLGEKKWFFRTAGPPWFQLILRVFQAWTHLVAELQITTSLRRHLLKLSEEIALPQAKNVPSLDPFAKKCLLRVLVTENGDWIANITFDANQAADLASILPEDVLEKVRVLKIDLEEISRRAISSNFAAQELFDLQLSQKQLRVWIE